jgi:hypothetical protein
MKPRIPRRRDQAEPPAASVANRAPDDRRSDERTRLLFAKSDDDVGPSRAMRERQDQTKL